MYCTDILAYSDHVGRWPKLSTREANIRICSRRTPTTSTYVQRISAEQAAIEDRLVELGVDNIQKLLNNTILDSPEDQMNVDQPQSHSASVPRPISAKQRALAKFVRIGHN